MPFEAAKEFYKLMFEQKEGQALWLLEEDPSISLAMTSKQQTAIQFSIIYRCPRVFDALLELETNFEHTDAYENTVLWTAMFAAYEGAGYYLEKLLPHFNDVHHQNAVGKSVWSAVQELQIPWLIEMVRPYA